MFTPPDRVFVLDTGEVLADLEWGRLIEIRDGSRRTAATLGRTPHYARKNRVSISRLGREATLIDDELARRRGLHTVSFCGLVWHWTGSCDVELPRWNDEGEIPPECRARARYVVPPSVTYARRQDDGDLVSYEGQMPPYWAYPERLHLFERYGVGEWQSETGHVNRFQERLRVTESELREFIARGAVVATLIDPLAPWRHVDGPPDPNGFEL